MYRKFNILNMLVNGKLRLPDKIKLAYRYKKNSTGKAYVYVFGYKPDAVKPIMLTYQYELYDSECPLERTMTTIIELKTVPMITDYMLVISNYEELTDLYNVVGVFDDTEIPYGRTTDDTEFDCGFTLQTFEINNGDIFSYEPTVTLNHSYFGGPPTHYRVSRHEGFSDTDWQSYVAIPTTELYTIGLNTFYFQLKTAEEESDILSDSIGWHGATWKFHEDEIELDILDFTMIDDVDFLLAVPDLMPIYTDDIEYSALDFTLTDTIGWTSIELTYPVGGEAIVHGTTATITWNNIGTIGNVDIWYQKAGIWILLVSDIVNMGSYAWDTGADSATTTYRIEVSPTGTRTSFITTPIIRGASKSDFSLIVP